MIYKFPNIPEMVRETLNLLTEPDFLNWEEGLWDVEK